MFCRDTHTEVKSTAREDLGYDDPAPVASNSESIWIKIAAVSLVIIAFPLGLMGTYWVHQCQRKRKLDHEFKFTLERFQQEDGDGISIYNIQHFNQLHENLPTRRAADDDNVDAEQANAEEAAANEGYDDDDDDDDEEHMQPLNNQPPPPPPPPSPPAKRRRIQTDFFRRLFAIKVTCSSEVCM
ncbi:unnamed protein product [Orchesella dallaii]|uniref:Uncharacterized protein n=1 Tax=Orchesella dallaii TaxID=48710 RepID=A0ABP1RH75_9HEXA